jgi:hypothetical protein
MTTLEVQPKDFPTSIPSTVSYNQGTTGFGSILPSQTDDSRLRGDRADLRLGFENDWRTEPTLAAREAEEIGMRSRQNVSTQNEKIGRSSRILATRRELSSSSPKRTPKRLPGRSPFTKFGTRSSQLLYRTADFIDSQDLSPESKDMGVFNFNTKSAPGSDTEDIVSKYSPKSIQFESGHYFTPSRVRRDGLQPLESANTFPREPFTEDEDSTDLDSDNGSIATQDRERRSQIRDITVAAAASEAAAIGITQYQARKEKKAKLELETKIADEEWTNWLASRCPEIPAEPFKNKTFRDTKTRYEEYVRHPTDLEQRINHDQDSDSPPNELATLSQKFGKMGWKMRKGNAMSQISSTISKDNTLGECVRNAKLLADFAKKHQRFTFGSGEQAPEDFAEESDTQLENIEAQEVRRREVYRSVFRWQIIRTLPLE